VKANFNTYITFEKEREILEYCNYCLKKTSCEMNDTLNSAMGENIPWWSEKFIAVYIPTTTKQPNNSRLKVFCTDYKSRQLTIPGIPKTFSDGVERLIEIVKREEENYNNINKKY